ncbi:MAG: hypothetical protein E7500_01000 [Ruminococcus sp.]|nr:hypothetical protein [Ruminococcus sp.]
MAMIISSDRNNGYPRVDTLPELSSITLPSVPYPKYMMRCLGEEINNGYPCIMPLAGVVREVSVNLFFAHKKAEAMYYNNQPVTSAYCNGETIAEVIYRIN